MAEAKRGGVYDGVTSYPVRCEGLCDLPEAVLGLVGGVLSGNCPGPKTPLQGEARVEIVSSGDRVRGAGITFESAGEQACRNPRVANLARQATDFTMYYVL